MPARAPSWAFTANSTPAVTQAPQNPLERPIKHHDPGNNHVGPTQIKVPELPKLPRVELLEHFEGTVIGVRGQDLIARIRSLRDADCPERRLALDLCSVADDDRPLVLPGAVFYWAVGFRTESGTKFGFSTVKFRRLPAWTRGEVERVREGARRWDALFREP